MSTDGLGALKTVLTTNWNASNTNSITPLIGIIYEDQPKETNPMTGSNSLVNIYQPGQTQYTPLDLGYGYNGIEERGTLDVRASLSRAHALNIVTEIKRILLANRKILPGYDLLEYKTEFDLSNKSYKVYRYIIEVKLTIFGEAI